MTQLGDIPEPSDMPEPCDDGWVSQSLQAYGRPQPDAEKLRAWEQAGLVLLRNRLRAERSARDIAERSARDIAELGTAERAVAGDTPIRTMPNELSADFPSVGHEGAAGVDAAQHDASQHDASCPDAPVLVASSSGAPVSPAPVSPAPTRSSGSTGRARKLPPVIGLIVASMVVVVTLVMAWQRPAYSYAAMLQALSRQSWVETSDGVVSPRRYWLSFRRFRVVAQNDDGVVYDDLARGITDDFRTDEHVVYRTQRVVDQTPTPSALLFRLLQLIEQPPRDEAGAAANEHAANEHAAIDWEELGDPVHETWRDVVQNQERLVELTVRFADKQPHTNAVGVMRHVVFLLDPETHLPRSCRFVGSDPSPQVLWFDYPDQAPEIVGHEGSAPPDVPVQVRRQDSINAIVRAAEESAAPESAAPESPPSRPSDASSDAVASNGSNSRGDSDRSAVPGPGQRGQATRPPRLPPLDTVTSPASPHTMAIRINELLDRQWQQLSLQPAAMAEDDEFLRRVYLDLLGRIPSVYEARRFLSDPSPTRRGELVERLLVSWDHATHFAARWRSALVPPLTAAAEVDRVEQFELWLAEQLFAGQAYDQIMSDLLLAEGRIGDTGPLQFYALAKLQPEELATRTARALFGVQLDCAQCHDHPFQAWQQEDFWGFAAFFARISQPQAKMQTVSEVLLVQDATSGDVMFPQSNRIVSPRYLDGTPFDDLIASQLSPDQSSRRAALVDWARNKQNPFLPRAAVNRVWSQLFGQGIVEPVDDLTGNMTADAQVLLDELAGFFVAQNYNVQALTAAIVMSDAYQRSSRWQGERGQAESHFAVMAIKPLRPEQLYDCLTLATMSQSGQSTESNDVTLPRFGNASRQTFLAVFGGEFTADQGYQTGITQALELIHGRAVRERTTFESSPMLQALSAPFFTAQQRLDTVFLATLSRYPTPLERSRILPTLEAAEDDREQLQVFADLLWAIVNSAEFQLNS